MGAVLLVSASASADVVIVPAAIGHYVAPFLTGQTQNDWFTIENNSVCGKVAVEHYWNTPLVLQNFTGGEVDVYASRQTSSTSTSKSNAYTASENGAIYQFSGGKTNNNYLGDVVVPTNGTLFTETTLNDSIDDLAGCVHQFRVEW